MQAIEKAITAVQNWRTRRRELRRLGSDNAAERADAGRWFAGQGMAGRKILRRALFGSPRCGCGAADALGRLGEPAGVRTMLRRCYEEEWLSYGLHSDYKERTEALRWLNGDSIGREFERALKAAECETELMPILAQLSLALSALRVLKLFDEIPPAILERGLLFGHRRLARLPRTHDTVLALNLTDALRGAALRGLLACAPDTRLRILADALHGSDLSAVRSAILGLRLTGDFRAAALLHPFAFSGGHPLAEQARSAYARLAGDRADPLLLLRPSQEDLAAEELLRPAAPAARTENRDLLRVIT